MQNILEEEKMKDFHVTKRNKIGERMKDNSILLLFAGQAPKKTADEGYKFTPNRNFYYMTGIDEENVILSVKKMEGKITESLFIKRRDPVMVKWVGETISEETAKETSGVEDVRYLDTFESFLNQAIVKDDLYRVYLDLEKEGYDQIPTGSNDQNNPKSIGNTVEFCSSQIADNRLLGFMQTFWMPTTSKYRDPILQAIDLTGEARIRFEKK